MADVKRPIPWNTIFLVTVVSIALFQAIGYLIGLYVPSVATLVKASSAIWFLILLSLSVYVAWSLLRLDMRVDKKQLLILLVILAVLIFFMYKLSPILPSIFDVKAIVGSPAYSWMG